VSFPLLRITHVHHLFINGYVRRQKTIGNIAPDLNTLIMQYVNFYFIKFSYQQTCDQRAVAERKQVDNVPEYRYWTLHKNETFRQIIRRLEEHYQYDYDALMSSAKGVQPNQYCYFVRLWTKFKHLQPIYPPRASTMKSMLHFATKQTVEYDTNANQERWVEIPNDFEDATIIDFDKLIANVDQSGVLELGVDRYNTSTKRWMFAGGDAEYEDHTLSVHNYIHIGDILALLPENTVQCLLFTGLPYGTTARSLWRAIRNVTKKKLVAPRQPKTCSSSNEALVYMQTVDVRKLATVPFCKLRVHGIAVKARVINEQEEQQWIHQHHPRSPHRSKYSTNGNAAASTLSTTKRQRARARNWKCVLCGARNDKTCVICLGCFADKDEALYEDDEVDARAQRGQPWTSYLQIGDIVDAMSKDGKWYEAVIRYTEMSDDEKILFVHFIGRRKKWDEKLLASDAQRVAKRGSKTIGPHRPKRPDHNGYKPQEASLAYPAFVCSGKESECARNGLLLY